MSNILEPEGVVRASAAVRQRCRTRRTETIDRRREQPQEGARDEQSVAQGALEHGRRDLEPGHSMRSRGDLEWSARLVL